MKLSKFILFFLLALIFYSGCGKTTATPTPPVLNSVTLSDTTDSSTTTTDSLTVNVAISASGDPTEMILSESSNFAKTRTASWVDFHASGAFTFTGTAGTKTLYCKLKNTAGESNTVSQSITYQPPTPPPPPPVTKPEWFTWWGGRSAHQISSANSVMLDENAPLNDKSAAWIGVYPVSGPNDDPQHITDRLNARLAQGYSKAFFEVERGLSRNEIQAINDWAQNHPNFKLFLWMVSYNWINPYGSPPAEGNFGPLGRLYCFWDEFQDSPDNVILCWQVYFSMKGVLPTADFSDDTVAASEELAYLEQNYMPFIEQFSLQNQSLFVLSLGGYRSNNPHFDLNDLTREMNLCKAKLPLGLGFFGTTEGWANDGAIAAADNFCTAWLAE